MDSGATEEEEVYGLVVRDELSVSTKARMSDEQVLIAQKGRVPLNCNKVVALYWHEGQGVCSFE